MNLDESFTFIHHVVMTANQLGICNLIFENGYVRGIDSDKRIVICHHEDIPVFPFNSLALVDGKDLMSRYELIIGGESSEVEYVNSKCKRFVTAVRFKSKFIKTEIRTPNATSLRVPKKVNFNCQWQFELSYELRYLMLSILKITSTSSNGEFSICGKSGQVEASFVDGKDNESTFLLSEYISMNDSKDYFNYRYPMKEFSKFLKQMDDDLKVQVSENGIMRLCIYGITVYLMPIK